MSEDAGHGVWGRLVGALRAPIGRGAAGSFAVKVASSALLFLSHVIFARQLGVEGYGVFVVVVAWLNILVLGGRLGFDLATVRFVSVYAEQEDAGRLRGFLRVAVTVALLGTGLLATALAVGAVVFDVPVEGGERAAFLWAAAAMPLFALVQIGEAGLRGMKQVVVSWIPQAILHPLILVAAFPALVWLDLLPARPDVAMAVYFGGSVAAAAVVWGLLLRALPSTLRTARPTLEAGPWIRTAASMMLIMGFGVAVNQGIVLLIDWQLTVEDAGLFGAATRVANVLQLAIVAVNATLAPYAARLHAAGDTAGLRRTIGLAVSATFAATLFGGGVVLALGDWVLGIMGPQFTAAYPVLVVLIAAQIAYGALAPAGVLLNMTGHQNASARILGISGGAGLVVAAALLPVFGLMGAAVASLATVVLSHGWMALAARRHLGVLPVFGLVGRGRGQPDRA